MCPLIYAFAALQATMQLRLKTKCDFAHVNLLSSSCYPFTESESQGFRCGSNSESELCTFPYISGNRKCLLPCVLSWLSLPGCVITRPSCVHTEIATSQRTEKQGASTQGKREKMHRPRVLLPFCRLGLFTFFTARTVSVF